MFLRIPFEAVDAAWQFHTALCLCGGATELYVMSDWRTGRVPYGARGDTNVTSAIESYFDRLDAAPIGPGAMFPTQMAKDHHESLLTYAQRKSASAAYHLANVRKFLERDARRLTESPQDLSPAVADMISEPSFTLTLTADEYVYELSAFLGRSKAHLIYYLRHLQPI